MRKSTTCVAGKNKKAHGSGLRCNSPDLTKSFNMVWTQTKDGRKSECPGDVRGGNRPLIEQRQTEAGFAAVHPGGYGQWNSRLFYRKLINPLQRLHFYN